MLYYKKVDIAKDNDSLAQIYRKIAPHTKVLDVGCGCGGLAECLAKIKKCDVYGLEFNPASVEFCKKSGYFKAINCQDLNLLNDNDYSEYRHKFDYIVCADVLEHLIFPQNVVRILKTWIKSDGKIIISLPNIAHASIKANLLLNDFTYTDIGILDRTHLHFYTYKTIAQFLEDAELKIEEADTVRMPFDGWQPHSLSELPEAVCNFIKKDKHSQIMQYIMFCSVAKGRSAKQNIIQLENVVEGKMPQANISFKLKRLLVSVFPHVLRWGERFVQRINK